MLRFLCCLVLVVLSTSLAFAGGVDPRDMPPQKPVQKEKVTATPDQTSAAVSKARQVVAPQVKEERIVAPQPKAVAKPPVVKSSGSTSWMVRAANGSCSPLSSVAGKVKVGSFQSPQELAHKMRQRGHQAFALDVGDTPDQEVRVKVPDRQLDLTFVRAGVCR